MSNRKRTNQTMKPTAKYRIGLCDCRSGDYRGEVAVFYEIDSEGVVRCLECGNIPSEVPSKVPENHRIQLDIIHDLDDMNIRRYREYHEQ